MEGSLMNENQFSDRLNEGQRPAPGIELVVGAGVLEITDKGYGFLRQARNDYRATPGDIFVGKDFVRHGGLRTGLLI